MKAIINLDSKITFTFCTKSSYDFSKEPKNCQMNNEESISCDLQTDTLVSSVEMGLKFSKVGPLILTYVSHI